MKGRTLLVAAAVAALLAAGSLQAAQAQGYGPGMMGGYGPGPGYYGHMGSGYGPGWMHRNWRGDRDGPRNGYGPGYRRGWGRGAGYGCPAWQTWR